MDSLRKDEGKVEMFQDAFFFKCYYYHYVQVLLLFGMIYSLYFFLQNDDDSLRIGEVTKADGRSATSYRTHAAHLKKT